MINGDDNCHAYYEFTIRYEFTVWYESTIWYRPSTGRIHIGPSRPTRNRRVKGSCTLLLHLSPSRDPPWRLEGCPVLRGQLLRVLDVPVVDSFVVAGSEWLVSLTLMLSDGNADDWEVVALAILLPTDVEETELVVTWSSSPAAPLEVIDAIGPPGNT